MDPVPETASRWQRMKQTDTHFWFGGCKNTLRWMQQQQPQDQHDGGDDDDDDDSDETLNESWYGGTIREDEDNE